MSVSYIRVTSQINCGDVTILNQKRLSSAPIAKSAIHNCFSGIVCSGHQIACKKYNNAFVTVNNDVLGHSWCDLPMIFTRDFVTRENCWQTASLLTQKPLFTATHALFFISYQHQLIVNIRRKPDKVNGRYVRRNLCWSQMMTPKSVFDFSMLNIYVPNVFSETTTLANISPLLETLLYLPWLDATTHLHTGQYNYFEWISVYIYTLNTIMPITL